MMKQKTNISTDIFDQRVSKGDNMSEYFIEYLPCNKELDELIEEIHQEQNNLMNDITKYYGIPRRII